MTIRTHNALKLGDNLIHLNFLRRLAKGNPLLKFEHRLQSGYLEKLKPLVSDLPQIRLAEITPNMGGSLNCWRGAENYWYEHPLRNDFAAFHVEWFAKLAAQMGLESPIKYPADMLLDAPCLNPDKLVYNKWDVLLLDSVPTSGQWPQFDFRGFYWLENELRGRGLSILRGSSTIAKEWGIADLGMIAGRCKYVIGTANGPMWTALNTWAAQTVKQWVLFIGNGEVVKLTPNTVCTHDFAEALACVDASLKA